MTVLVTGSTGLVGTALVKLLKAENYTVKQLTTRSEKAGQDGFFYWNPVKGEIDPEALSDIHSIIHLAGSSIGEGRWTPNRKKEILESRTLSTQLLYKELTVRNIHLQSFISASATGYYGGKTSETIYDEYSPAGTDFLANVCVEWEKAADLFQEAGIRTVKLRTGVVLAPQAPALAKMLLPIKLGVGSPLGNGRQHMPWIHIDDLCAMYHRALTDETMKGAWNAVAPSHLTNRQLMKSLAEKLKKPFFFPPVPSFLLKLLLGEMAILITDGSRVVPRRFNAAGFAYQHPDSTSLEVI